MRGVERSESSPDPSARQVRSSSVRCLRIGGGIRGNVGLPRFWRLVDGRIGEDSWFCSRLVHYCISLKGHPYSFNFVKLKFHFFFSLKKVALIVVLRNLCRLSKRVEENGLKGMYIFCYLIFFKNERRMEWISMNEFCLK